MSNSSGFVAHTEVLGLSWPRPVFAKVPVKKRFW